MKWIKFTLDTTTEAVDFISLMLSELGIEGIEINNVGLTMKKKANVCRYFTDYRSR